MRLALALTVLLVSSAASLPASEFDWMTREFARQSGAQQLHPAIFGFARFVVAIVHPAGATDLRMAVFEHAQIDSHAFTRIADSAAGSAWKPMIRVRESNGEITNIYAQPDGKHVKLLIATYDKDDTVFIEVRVQPQALMKFVEEHSDHHHA